MTLSIFRDTFADRKTLSSVRGRRAGEVGLDALTAVQTVVDALTDGNGGRYKVAFSAKVEASTSLQSRAITISSAPLTDGSIKLREAVEVMVGLTTHEVGHTILTPALQAALEHKYGTPVPALIHKTGNVLDDVRLERWMAARFPGIGGSFKVTIKYVGRKTIPAKVVVGWTDGLTLAQRFNFFVAATRYRAHVSWLGSAATRRERQYWVDWAATYAADPENIDLLIAGIDVAATKLRLPVEPESNQPDEDEPVETPESDDDEPPTTDCGPNVPNDDDDDDGGLDDEDGDDEPGPGGEGKDDKPAHQTEPTTEAGPPSESLDGTWNPHLDLSNGPSWNDERLQNAIDIEAATERFVDRAGYGNMKVIVD